MLRFPATTRTPTLAMPQVYVASLVVKSDACHSRSASHQGRRCGEGVGGWDGVAGWWVCFKEDLNVQLKLRCWKFFFYRMIYMYYMFKCLHMSNDMSLRALFFLDTLLRSEDVS